MLSGWEGDGEVSALIGCEDTGDPIREGVRIPRCLPRDKRLAGE